MIKQNTDFSFICKGVGVRLREEGEVEFFNVPLMDIRTGLVNLMKVVEVNKNSVIDISDLWY